MKKSNQCCVLMLMAMSVFAAEKKPEKRGTFELPPGIEVKPLKEQIQDEINRASELLKTFQDQYQKLTRFIQHMRYELQQPLDQERCKKLNMHITNAQMQQSEVRSRVVVLQSTIKNLRDVLRKEATAEEQTGLKTAKATIGDYRFIVQGEQRSPSEPGFRGFDTPTQFVRQIERFYGDAMTKKIYKEKTPAFKK